MSDEEADAPPSEPGDPSDPERRAVLTKLTVAAGCAVGAATLVGPTGVALSPLVAPEPAEAQEADSGWLDIDAVTRFVVGASPTRIVVRRDTRDQWLLKRGETLGAVLVERLAEAEFRVLSAVCPHLGCSVIWRAPGWRCPCHNSAFTREGALVPSESGPPNPAPRALDPLEWRIAGSRLEVRWVRYETGIAERVAIG